VTLDRSLWVQNHGICVILTYSTVSTLDMNVSAVFFGLALFDNDLTVAMHLSVRLHSGSLLSESVVHGMPSHPYTMLQSFALRLHCSTLSSIGDHTDLCFSDMIDHTELSDHCKISDHTELRNHCKMSRPRPIQSGVARHVQRPGEDCITQSAIPGNPRT
jgi:hypothetical protein